MKRTSKNIISVLVLLITTATITYAESEEKILIVLTSHSELGNTEKETGFWLPELTLPYYKFKEAGYTVDVASIKGGIAPIDQKIFKSKEEDKSNEMFLKNAELMSKVFKTIPLSQIDSKQYKAILYAGGSGTMWDFPNNEYIKNITKEIYENNGIVSAVCHGPSALINVKLSNGKYLISGKKITSFTNEEEKDLDFEDKKGKVIEMKNILPFLLQDKLKERGAKYIYGKAWKEKVIVDGRLITGQNSQSASKVADKVIEYLQKINRY
ncbi:MAG TPA: type 1 glutamine amidotransferase domain-containing protein [Sulfurimonas autotrophica]|nr:type 1 glutamine amidotransferase domain-containing protein [Sulfurimonas autotrophica]